MSYYTAGRGDYYRGDFLGSLGKVVKQVAKVGGGFLTGGVGGAVTAAAGAFGKNFAQQPPRSGTMVIPMPGSLPGIIPGNILPGGRPALAPDQCPSGYHYNKNFVKGSGSYANICVRNRSMNYGNGRALKRSIRRMRGAAKMFKQSLRFTAPKMPKGRIIAKGRGKR